MTEINLKLFTRYYPVKIKYFFNVLIISLAMTSYAENIIDTRSLFEKLVAVRPLISPGTSIATPIAYGIGFGTIYFGVAGQLGTQYTSRPFGEYALGFGLGDAKRFVALTTTVSFGGLDEVVRDGNLNFQISRSLNDLTAIALGIENVAPWGADCRNKPNAYAVLSSMFSLFLGEDYAVNFIGSLGIGNNRFVHDYEIHRDESNRFWPFASLGVEVLPQLAMIFDYVGQTYNIGLSVVPFPQLPLSMSLSALDLTHQGGNRIPIAASIGYAYNFK